ncbi:40S ribosomal protein S21 [Mucor velutinosus]|uniref:40S ribosomal protein S21 n=1 Tax=Mucor velutinosus TaxID=708070 RepID=A0AAN7DEF9_9FUNG|nr:40S ribosomal protein S21 [Mucor velutinosus]
MKFKILKEKFKPIYLKSEPWNHQHSIKKIIKSSLTTTGTLYYTVLFKDGQIKKIASKSLKDKYATLIKHFEPLNPPKSSIIKQHYPTARSSKRISFKENSSDEYENEEDEDEEEEEEEEEDDSEESEEMEESRQTRRGRLTAKPKSFQKEFYPDQFQPDERFAKKPLTVYVPPYTDDLFLEYHSEHCLRCLRTGNPNDNSKLQIGTQAKRTRLLLCQSCSISMHNNCISSHKQVDKTTQSLKCPKCVRGTNCSRCNTSILKTRGAKITPFRCLTCNSAFHHDCIIAGSSSELRDKLKSIDLADMYRGGQCIECFTFLKDKVPHIIAGERKVDGMLEYYVKWKDLSYRHASWVSAKWIANYSQGLHRGYLKRKEKEGPVVLSEDVVCIDRILDVEWADAKRTQVKKVLAVFKDTEYADAVWDEPPPEDDEKLYADYQNALKRYVLASKVLPPKNMKGLIANVRSAATKTSYESRELKAQPDFLKGGTLMKHQMEALNWLLYQWEKCQPCILADDMGLGKTIQVISFLFYLYRKFVIYPFLIVVPNSTATNWVREFAKWAPEMIVVPYFGLAPARKLAMDNEILNGKGQMKCHVVIATYESAIETSKLHDIFWPVLIVDESQRLKNDESLLFKTLARMKVDHIILLTGTPMQNKLRELFNIMHFIRPLEFKGDEADNYQEMTRPQIEELHSRLKPYFLRRTKQEVLKKLPPKYELIVPISMTPLQKEVYKLCLSSEIIETLTEATGTKRQKGLTNIFTNLRKTLNHPYLLDGVELEQPTPADVQKSMIEACGKLKLFHQMLPKLLERGHRVLLFSTMTRNLDIVEDYLDYEQVKYVRIDGSTKENNRVKAIDAFNAPYSKINVFLLSTRAGGVGINLATADTVIIWDSDFNPYADLQAISRAHRIGQANMVIIYRFMTRLSVEEKILQIGKKKMALEHVVVERMKADEEEQIEDLESILKYGTEALFDNDDSKDIRYDDAAIDNLLNREQYREAATELQIKEVEELEGREKDEGSMSFSYAKVWQADGTTEELEITEKDDENESDFWEKFLIEQQAQKEKKRQEKREAELKLGRGGRKRTAVSYAESNNIKPVPISLRRQQGRDDEFVLQEEESEDDDNEDHGFNKPDLNADMTHTKKPKLDEMAPKKKSKASTHNTSTVVPLQPVRQIPLTEWEWIIPARYQQVLWYQIVFPGINDICNRYATDHPTTANAPTAQYGHHKAAILSDIWKRVHEFSKTEMDKEFLAEVGSGLSPEVATERFHLKFAFYNENVNRLLHQVMQGYIHFYENEVYYKIKRSEINALQSEDKLKADQLRALDSQHEVLRTQLNGIASNATAAFTSLFEQKIAFKRPPSFKPIQPSSGANSVPASTVPQAMPTASPVTIVQYQPPAIQPQVRPLNAAAPPYNINGQRISFDQNQQQKAIIQHQQVQLQQQRNMINAPNNGAKQILVSLPAPASTAAYKQAPVPVYQQPPSALNIQSPSPVANQSPAAATYSSSPASSSRVPSTKASPVNNAPVNNQQSDAAQRRQEQLFLNNFIQKLCSFPAVQLVNMLNHLKDNAVNYRPTSAQNSARLKTFSEMNPSQMMQLLNLFQWRVIPGPPVANNTNQHQQSLPPTLCFDQSQLDAIIAKKTTIENITKQFDDDNIYTAISLLSKGHVELFEKLSDAELLKFFGDPSILQKLVIIFRNLDTQASGSSELAKVDNLPPVSSLVNLISDSTVQENAVKLLELDKEFYQKSLEERIKKYLSVVDSIKSLKMYTRIMKRLSKGIPQLNSPSNALQSTIQQPQTSANNNNTSSMSLAPQLQPQPSQTPQQTELQHPQLSFPLAHLDYPQDPPTNN